MRLISIALLISFGAIAVLGFLGMMHSDDHSHLGCIGAAVQDATCPEGGLLASVNFHLGALLSFSQGITAGFFAVVLATLISLVIARGLVVRGLGAVPFVRSSSSYFLDGYTTLRRRMAAWLALFETSPTAASGALG